MLKGAASPLDTLFPEGRTSLAEGLYERSAVARYFNDIVASIVSTAVALQPADRCLQVLELGAGTGGTTAAVLPSSILTVLVHLHRCRLFVPHQSRRTVREVPLHPVPDP